MPDLPARFAALTVTFAPLFQRSWPHARLLLVGAILAPGRRTVASALRITGHARDRHFTNDHRVLSRAPWSARDASRILLGYRVPAFAPRGPVILGPDETVERRSGTENRDMRHLSGSGALVALALLCTDVDRTSEEIVTWFARRWRIETTFEEVRTHLGVETRRQWSDRAIARTTPCLLALFSIVSLPARTLPARQRRSATAAAWSPKARPTFSDALAAVRRAIWRGQHVRMSPQRTDRRKVPFRLPQARAQALCNAA